MGRTLKDNKFRNNRKKKSNRNKDQQDEFSRKRVNGIKQRIFKTLEEQQEDEDDSFDGEYCVNQ